MFMIRPKRVKRKLTLIYSFRPVKRDNANRSCVLPTPLMPHYPNQVNEWDDYLDEDEEEEEVIEKMDTEEFNMNVVVNMEHVKVPAAALKEEAPTVIDNITVTEPRIPPSHRKTLSYKNGQWSPDNVQGKKKYDRDFLMELKDKPQSKKKPENLPDLDIVLKDSNNRQQSRGMPDQRQMVNRNQGAETFGGNNSKGPMPKRISQQDKPGVMQMSRFLREDLKTENAFKRDIIENKSVTEHKIAQPLRKTLSYKDGQWSPDNVQGKKKYDRDFLMELKEDPQSKKKPENLPDLDIVLKDSKNKRMRNSQQDKPSVIQMSHFRDDIKTKGASKPDVRKKMKAKIADIECNITEDDLSKTLQKLLDNLTSENIGSLKPIIQSLPILHEDQMQYVINQVFLKAASKPVMCATYAEVCRLLSHTVVQDRLKRTERKCMPLIVEHCNSEFNSYKKYRAQESYDLRGEALSKMNDLPRHLPHSQGVQETYLGKVLLFGELYNVNLATAYFIRQWISELLNARDEQSLLCLCRLLKIVGKNMESQKSTCLEGYFQTIKILTNPGKTAQISTNVLFKLHEVIKLRQSGWVSLAEMYPEGLNMTVGNDIEDKENLSLPLKSSCEVKHDAPDPTPTSVAKRRKSNEGRVIPCPDLLTEHVTCDPRQESMTQFQGMDVDVEMKTSDVLIERCAAIDLGVKNTNSVDIDAMETDGEDVQDQDLNAHVLHLLKRLDADKSEGLNVEIQSLPIDTNQDMKQIVNLLYDKAMKDPTSSLSCARMMKALGGVPDTRDMIYGNYEHQLRLLIAERCCTQLTENTELETKRDAQLKRICAERDAGKNQQLLKKCRGDERRLRKVFAAFIGFSVQLFKFRMISPVMIHRCIRHLMSSGDATSLECLCELFMSIGSELESLHRADLSDYFSRLEVIAKFHSDRNVSVHLRALILHVIELRQGKWKTLAK